MWANTHNDSLKEKMSAMVSVLSACQEKMGTGYLSAFPFEQFDHFEAIKPVWAPYYTIHKILAGLLDQHVLAGNARALKMVTWMVEYFFNRVKNVISKYSIEKYWLSLNEETGGMNDVLYRLYSITGDQKHLLLAHLFDKPFFLGVLAIQAKVLEPLGAVTSGSQFLEPDGLFPNHIPNPEDKATMKAITQAVLDNKADLGIIFDTDVDRVKQVALQEWVSRKMY